MEYNPFHESVAGAQQRMQERVDAMQDEIDRLRMENEELRQRLWAADIGGRR